MGPHISQHLELLTELSFHLICPVHSSEVLRFQSIPVKRGKRMRLDLFLCSLLLLMPIIRTLRSSIVALLARALRIRELRWKARRGAERRCRCFGTLLPGAGGGWCHELAGGFGFLGGQGGFIVLEVGLGCFDICLLIFVVLRFFYLDCGALILGGHFVRWGWGLLGGFEKVAKQIPASETRYLVGSFTFRIIYSQVVIPCGYVVVVVDLVVSIYM